MNIAFFGSSPASQYCLDQLLESAFSVKLIVTQPDRPAGRGKRLSPSSIKKTAEINRIPILQPFKIRKDPETLDAFKKLQPDLNVVVAYGQIIPASIIYLPRYHSINLHFSMLPAYRGASPVQWALLNGETSTGVSVFELSKKMDEGPVYLQEKTEIYQYENTPELQQRLTRIGTDLLLKTISQIDRLTPQPQDHSQATFAPLIRKDDGRIQWNNSSSRISNQIRAFQPWPSSFCYQNGKRIKIIRGMPGPIQHHDTKSPGEVLSVGREGILISCGDSQSYLIQELQLENKKALTAFQYSIGARLQPGVCFE